MRNIMLLGLAMLAACTWARQNADLRLDKEGLSLRPLAALGLGEFQISVRP